jgi:hypothetical protein
MKYAKKAIKIFIITNRSRVKLQKGAKWKDCTGMGACCEEKRMLMKPNIP